jgi:hypothetical protein
MHAIALPLNATKIHTGTFVFRICYEGKRKKEPKMELFIISHKAGN